VFVPGPADITKIREIGWERWTAATRYNDEWYKRARKNRLRGARIGLGYVTPQRAAAYGFDVNAWRAMVLEASSVEPREIAKAGRRIAAALSREGRLEITAPNGTRFACDLKGRESRVDDGVVSEEDLDDGENMASIPAGEAYVVPDARSAEGTIVFDRPIGMLGQWVRGVSMAFDGGRLAKWSASENEDMIRPDWERAKGEKDRLGYVDIGLNPKARTGFLQDVIVAGNVYVAVGDNEEAGGKNKTDFFLGASLTGATVTVDGKTLVDRGNLPV
jgi:leucyl aminopeptidase (aminopeptidase T)